CPMPVVDAADAAGSTDFIVKAIQAAPAGSTFAIGTEINLVQRLAAEHPEHIIFCLDPVVCPCSTMYRIHPGYLAWVLEELVAGRVVNRIEVGDDVAEPARVALERMLAAKPPASVTVPAGSTIAAATDAAAAVAPARVAPAGA
ncbi:MAG TPA: quinolinate synthase NadA, partial [Agromyces sp.]